MTPNSSIHILAKSSENIHPNAGHDWVDLKERLEESGSKGQQSAEADKVQHEVAALKMAQGLLKGMTSLLCLLSLLWRPLLPACG